MSVYLKLEPGCKPETYGNDAAVQLSIADSLDSVITHVYNTPAINVREEK